MNSHRSRPLDRVDGVDLYCEEEYSRIFYSWAANKNNFNIFEIVKVKPILCIEFHLNWSTQEYDSLLFVVILTLEISYENIFID